MPNDGSGRRLSSIERTFDIIEEIKELDGARVSELADRLEMPKSTVHNHLTTLVNRGYLVKYDGEYRLGLDFLNLGRYVKSDWKYEIVESKVHEIAEETGERTMFLVEEHGYGIYVFVETPPDVIKPGKWVYKRRSSLHAASSGKTVLAHLPEAYARDIVSRHGLPQLTENTHTSIGPLFEEMEVIREQGYALNREEHMKGVRSVSAPVFYPDDRFFGALSVAAPVRRLNGDRFRSEIPQLLMGIADEIQLRLRYASEEVTF
ncbi:IclR family transcriptional regulator [Natronorarus salvus]|uniref:IclR family transcriptional regulator n=1 Tax=Natronorarus salvus TaxID=3117733 RepID=UPI002F266312